MCKALLIIVKPPKRLEYLWKPDISGVVGDGCIVLYCVPLQGLLFLFQNFAIPPDDLAGFRAQILPVDGVGIRKESCQISVQLYQLWYLFKPTILDNVVSLLILEPNKRR